MKRLSVLFLFLLSFACENVFVKNEDCSAVSCAVDFSNLYFEVINKETGENLIKKSSFTLEDINFSDEDTIEVSIDSTTYETTTLNLTDTRWAKGEFEYKLTVADTIQLDIQIGLERDSNTGCCSNLLFLKVIEINDFVYDPLSFPIKILVD